MSRCVLVSATGLFTIHPPSDRLEAIGRVDEREPGVGASGGERGISSKRAEERRPLAWVARAIVWLRFLIVAAWIAAVALATIHLPSAFESESSDAESLVPHSSRAVEVEEKAVKTFGEPLISRTMVVASGRRGSPPGSSAKRAATSPAPIPGRQNGDPRGAAGRHAGAARLGEVGDDAGRLPLHPARPQRRRTTGGGRRVRRRARAGERRGSGEGHWGTARDARRSRRRQQPHPLGGDRDRAARRRDPRLLLRLARRAAARPGGGRRRVPRGRPGARLERRTIRPVVLQRGGAGDRRPPLRRPHRLPRLLRLRISRPPARRRRAARRGHRGDRRAAAGDHHRGADDRGGDADAADLRRRPAGGVRAGDGDRRRGRRPRRADPGPRRPGDLRPRPALAARRRRSRGDRR